MFKNSTTQTFEETYKNAYSHGLETIYALENIDLKSIRHLKISSPEIEIKKKDLVSVKSPNQLKLDFGQGFRGWITPFILHEPIQVLDLSRYGEKILLELNKRYLADLLNLESPTLIKRIGQGHLEEIKEKTQHYFKGKELKRTPLIDFSSLMRCIIFEGGLRKKMCACLKKYGLEGLVTLLPSENMELRRLTLQVEQEWIYDALQELQSEKKIRFVKEKIGEIVEELIKPWLRQRHGIATKLELLEKLEGLAIEPNSMDQIILFLSDVCYSKQFPFGEKLHAPSTDIYCIDSWHAQAFRDIVTKANTYFYKASVTYLLDELVLWLKREFAKSWLGYPDGMMERMLLLCNEFYFWKGNLGKIEVKKLF